MHDKDHMYGVICMSKYIHGRTCVYNINYHIVWCVKYRRKVLSPQISDKLYELVQSIAEEKGFTVIDCKVVNRIMYTVLSQHHLKSL